MDLQPDQSEKIAQMVQGLKKKAISEQKEARKQIKHFIEGQQKQTTRSHFVLLMNEVYKIISTLINSNDHSDKMISVLLIDVLIEIKYEDPSSKVSRFSNHLKNLLLKHNITLSVIEKTTQVISNLAKFGGTMSSEFADSQIRLAIEFLHENRLESRRYAAVLLFTKLSITAPTIVNIHLSEYFDVIWVALSDPKIEIRKLAAKSLGNCFQLISTRDSQTRSQIYSTLYSEVQKNFNQSYADSIHGSVLVIAQLLKHSGDFMESYFEDICARIFRSKLPKTKSIRLAIVSLIPLLAKFSRNFFIEKYLETAVNHLFFLLNRDTLSRKTIFHSLGELTLVVENQIQPYSEEIIKKIVRSLNPKKKQYCEKSMICLSKLSHVCDIAEYIRRYKILDILFEISLSQTLTNTLSELAQFVPSFSFEIRHRLLNMISLIITKQQYNDMSLFHDQQMIIQPQITNLPTTTGFLNEQNMSEQTFLAFETIRTFDFQGHDLFKFLRYSILPFFNHENALLRKEAGLVCIQVINKNINENSELLYEIIDEIVSLCVRDPDPLIRTRLIKKLSKYRTQEINNHLLQTEILQKLFFLLYDEVNKNRKCSIRLLGELGTSNPGVILPVLRKLLISLLTEFEFSQDYVNKEQSVILIVNLIQSTHQLVVPYCESILNVFVPKLHQELQLNVSEPTVTEHLLLVIGALFEAGGSRLKKYVDDLFPFLLDSLQNQNLSIREAALHTLGQLIQSTGYVVEPYEKFPRLLSLLFKTIKSERDMGIKREALKVMGIVGALDPYQQKDKTTIQSGEFALESMRGEMKMGYGETMRENMIISPEKVEKIKGKKEKETLKKSQDLGNAGGEEKEKQANKTSGGQNKTGLKLVTVGGYGGYGETNEGYIGFWHSNVFKPSEKDEGDIQDTFEVTKYFAELSKAETDEFFAKIAITSLMRVIGDPSLGSTYHETAVQSLVLIFSNLEQDGKQFLPQVMPPLFGVIRKYDSMSKEFVFRQLYKVVNTFKRRVEPYLEQMLGLITEKWTRPLVAQIVLLVEEIALTFPDAISKYLPGLMPRFIHMIKTDRSENLQTTNKILHCMEVFGHSLEMYLQIVVPVVLGVLENENAPADVRVSAADAIRRISRRLDCSDYSAQIIHSVCRVLQPKKIVPHHHLAVYTTTAVENAAMRFLCEIAKQIGDRYKVFLPVVSDILSRSQIINKDHDSIVARLSEEPNIGWPTATDAEILGENILGAVDPRFVDSTPSNRRMITVLKINENNLREAWKVQNCLTKGDWEEWIRKFSTELLRESPSPALRSCATLAQMHHPLARNLFNAAFLGCWLALGEEEQRTLVASLEIALLSPTLPPDILQTLLNLAEFMEHVDRPLPIKIEFFGTLAEKCHAYAKALRYKERQFANDPSGAIGALVTISNKLQQTDAALGIINYSKKHHRIELQESWYEELNQWEDALAVYERKQLEEPLSVPLMVGRMRCLHSLGEWEKLVELSNKASKIADKKMLVTIATLAADAAWVTGNWDQMSLHITAISENTVPGAFLRAVIAVHSNEFVLAQKHIDRAREMLVVSLSALVSESYPRAYSEIVRVQQLSELEEIIEFKKASEGSPRRSMILRAWKKRLKGCEKSIDAWLRILTVRATVLDRKDDVSAWLKFSRICEKNGNPRLAEKTIKSILDLSAEISDSWRGPKNEHSDTNININKNIDSLSLSESPPDSLHLSAQKSSLTFISTLTSNSKLNSNLKLNSNTNSNLNTNLNTNSNINTNSNTKSKSKSVVRKTKSVLTSVGLSKPKSTPMPAVMSLSMPSQSSMKSWSTSISNSFRAQPLATLRYLEHLWSSNEHNQALSGLRHCLHQISSLTNNSTLEPHKLRRLEANAFLTHGKWQLALLDTRTSQHSMSEVLHAFSLSTKADPDWAKPWHYWAFAHFDVVECNNPQPLSPSDETRRKHLIPAINGFFRAIALTSPEKAIRDTLRLLTLWFRYARIPDVKHALKQGFATIPIDTWLQVIPQIIARINTPRRDVNELICYLLVEVGKVHPQSLVYSLTVAEKTAIRHQQQLDNALLLESKDDISPVRSSTISRNSPPNDDTLSEFSDDNEVESPPRMMLSRSKLQNFNELKNNQQDANVDANADVNTNTNSNLSIIINDSDSNSDSNSNSENIHNRTRHRIRTHTTNNASKIMEAIRHHFPHLVEQAQLVSEELIRIVVLWQETAAEFIDEALKMYFEEEDYDQSASLIQQLQDALRKPPETPHERAFVAEYGTDLRFAHAWFAKAQSNNDSNVMTKSWKLFYQILQKMTDEITAMRTLDLKQVSPKLYAANHLEIAVPGTYKIHSPVVRIESFSQSITVLKTKQRPRKLKLQGSDAFWHQFLLKGHEDLRQDERVMQLLGLVNTLLHHDLPNATRHLLIQRYAVVPLSPSSGLIGWVPHCDTLHDLIREYRDSHDIVPDLELQLMLQMAPDYTKLSLIQKVEVFSSALHSTNGLDLNRILWLKSQNSEVWLDKRTNYTRSLAVMSMVGYILGLGDRHPSNIMMSKFSGKIIHIDFGDCFEVAIHRQIFPERIPFRLTRMLVNAMEVSGIEGTFKSTCKSLLDILRTNKDSLMAMLEAFVYDPLFSWQFVNQQQQPHSKNSTVSPQINTPPNPLEILSSKPPNFSPFNPLDSPRKNSDPSNFFDSSQLDQLGHLQQTEVLNEKALEVLKRVSNKLSGRDFEPNETLDTSEQIKRLIDQATSYENLSQCYIGWCPFW